jgi:hypothetical protein
MTIPMLIFSPPWGGLERHAVMTQRYGVNLFIE